MRTSRSFAEKKYIVFFSLLGAVFFFALIYFTAGIWFENNDDVFISEMLSGKITGEAEYHSSFIGILVTWPVAMLYRAFHAVPWWGIVIFSMLFVAVWINLHYCMKSANDWIELSIYTVVEVALLVAGIHCFGQAQFSSAAMLLAFAGYSALLFGYERKSSWVVFAVSELIACSVRDTSMILVQPVGVMAFVGALLLAEDGKVCVKKLARKLIVCAAVAVGVLVIGKVASMLSFQGQDWKEWLKYNEARIYLTDYEPVIPYEELADTLSKYGISQEEYLQTVQYRTWYGENKFQGACLDELLPRLKEIRSQKLEAGRVIEASKQLLFTSPEFWHLHQLVAAFFIVLFIVAIVSGRYKALVATALTFCGYFVGVVFLAYRDRFVLRVMMPYYLGTLLLLNALLIYIIRDLSRERIRDKVAFVASGALVLATVAISVQIGRTQFAYMRDQNHYVNATYYADNRDIMNYCKANPENHYVLDMSYARYVSTDIFERDYYDYANHIYSGSWYANTPRVFDYCRDYISDGCYYIVREAQEFSGTEGVEYYAHMYGAEPVLADKYKLSSGATIWVWKIEL